MITETAESAARGDRGHLDDSRVRGDSRDNRNRRDDGNRGGRGDRGDHGDRRDHGDRNERGDRDSHNEGDDDNNKELDDDNEHNDDDEYDDDDDLDMDKDLDQGDRPLRSSSPLPDSEHSDRATETTDKRDGLPSYDKSLSSIGNISKDSRTSYWNSDVDMPNFIEVDHGHRSTNQDLEKWK